MKQLFLLGVLGLCMCTQVAFAAPPSNKKVGEEIDDITNAPKYKWLREGQKKPTEVPRSDYSSKSRTHSGRHGGDGRFEKPSKEGCSFDPQFKDKPEMDMDDSDDSSCGNDNSLGDCGCKPDLGGCGGCNPNIGSCSGCAVPPSALVPIGYFLGAIFIVVIIFFIVKAIVNRQTFEDSALEVEDINEDEPLRISTVQQMSTTTLIDGARDAAAKGDYKRAVGMAYLASISILSKEGFVELDKSTTNWKIIRQTKRNGGPSEQVRILVRHFEDLFFGSREATQNRWSECLTIFEQFIGPLEKEVSGER